MAEPIETYNPDYNPASHTTYVVSVNFILECRDLKFTHNRKKKWELLLKSNFLTKYYEGTYIHMYIIIHYTPMLGSAT